MAQAESLEQPDSSQGSGLATDSVCKEKVPVRFACGLGSADDGPDSSLRWRRPDGCSAAPTPEPTPDNIETAVAKAVATAVAASAAGPTPVLAPTAEETVKVDADAIAAAVAAAMAAANPTPGPSPDLTPEEAAKADAAAGPTPGPSPTLAPGVTPAPGPVPASNPTTNPSPTFTPEEIAKINADSEALIAAMPLALDYYFNGIHRGDKEKAIAHAVSITNADPAAVARAMDEALGSISGAAPLPIDPAAEGMSEAVAAAVALALEYLTHSPLDREGAVAHAVSMTNTDADAVATALNQVLNNPVGFPNLDAGIAVAAANAVSQATAIAGAAARADAAEAARQAAAKAAARAKATPTPVPARRYETWNDHEWLAEPKPWWRESNPYDCDPPSNPNSPWAAAGMPDLGGQDSLSLIRYFGNGSYVRYGLMGFDGCAVMSKHPDRTHLDTPADPAYYSLGNLDIAVDIARVPSDAPE